MPENFRVCPSSPTRQHVKSIAYKTKETYFLLGWGNIFHPLLGFHGPQMVLRGKHKSKNSIENTALMKFSSTRILRRPLNHSGDPLRSFLHPQPLAFHNSVCDQAWGARFYSYFNCFVFYSVHFCLYILNNSLIKSSHCTVTILQCYLLIYFNKAGGWGFLFCLAK